MNQRAVTILEAIICDPRTNLALSGSPDLLLSFLLAQHIENLFIK
jgi:hypothetical protein